MVGLNYLVVGLNAYEIKKIEDLNKYEKYYLCITPTDYN